MIFLPKLGDTTLVDEEIEKVVGRYKNAHLDFMAKHVSKIGIIWAAGFLEGIPYPDLVIEFRKLYGISKRCV